MQFVNGWDRYLTLNNNLYTPLLTINIIIIIRWVMRIYEGTCEFIEILFLIIILATCI